MEWGPPLDVLTNKYISTLPSDPRSLVTNYTVDGLGNVKTTVSPDSGTATSKASIVQLQKSPHRHRFSHIPE